MIAYETLVQAINDWRAGKRPTALTVSRPPSRSVLAANRSVADEGYDELEIDEANDLSDYGDDGGVYDEAADDSAVFDPAIDLHEYLLAGARIEHAWVDPQARYDRFSEYGIRDEAHYAQVRASVERYLASPAGHLRWGSAEEVAQLRAAAAQTAAGANEFSAHLVPVDGVTLQHWAYAQAQIAVGYDPAAVLAQLEIDEDLWARASAEWNERMARDTSGTIAGEYAQAYAVAQEQIAAATSAMEPSGDPPMAFERWVEIEQACEVLAAAGHPLPDILIEFETSPEEWHEATQWWLQYLAAHADENGGALRQRYEQLQAFYRDHYAQALGE